MKVLVRKLSDEAVIPTRATLGAACFDLHSTEGGLVTDDCPRTFGTGLAFEVPHGWAMLIYSRSGHGFKNGVRLGNCVGVIDSDYRGEVKIKLQAELRCGMHVAKGDRIAQAMFVMVPNIHLVEASELSETERGVGGFGSTGQ